MLTRGVIHNDDNDVSDIIVIIQNIQIYGITVLSLFIIE